MTANIFRNEYIFIDALNQQEKHYMTLLKKNRKEAFVTLETKNSQTFFCIYDEILQYHLDNISQLFSTDNVTLLDISEYFYNMFQVCYK